MNSPNSTFSGLTKGLLARLALAGTAMALSGAVVAQVDLAKAPLLTLKTAPGLVMLTMGRDLPLAKAAYNDVNDLDGDGVPDLFFKPTFRYEGYFAHDRCYDYDTSSSGLFRPVRIGDKQTPDINDQSKDYFKCLGSNAVAGQWSGNFLNWVAMARMDVLRKVLYGGKRSTDGTSTVLERAYVPQDSTLWGKEYASVTNDGFDIRDFTPLALPTGTTRHMFANTTLVTGSVRFAAAVNLPKMIVYENRPGRIWDLVAQERLILGAAPGPLTQSASEGTVITQYTVRTETCKLISGRYEDWCTGYPVTAPTAYKPTGLLHKYGEAKTLAFGLISGTYDNNYSGGVLRQNVDNFGREVNQSNGRYYDSNTVTGIVHHLNAFRPWGFAGGDWACGSFTGLPNNGACPAWGNPLGEMMFEGLKYFAGDSPTTAFTDRVGNLTQSPDSPEPSSKLNLKQPGWINPYVANSSRSATAAFPSCARPIQMTIGDPKTSFDSDQLPGSVFPIAAGLGTTSTATLGNLNVATEGNAIWASEFSTATKKFFIGEVPGNSDGNPSAKAVTSFGNIRGHGPDSTTNQGSFYGSAVARYGKYTGVNNAAIPGTKLRVDQVSIALDSHIPQIKIPLNGKTISIVLLSKSVNDYGISNAKGAYQQTGAITAFFVDKMANTNAGNADVSINGGRPYYKFRISFSDADQGNDNESDAKVTYEVSVTSATTLTVGMDYFNGSNGIEMHQGYVIAGTTADGVYLDVGGGAGFGVPPVPKVGYFLDTMPGKGPGSAMLSPATGPAYTNIATRLPRTTLAAPRTFTVGTGNNGEFIPHDMLWYAAKYGGAVGNDVDGFLPKVKSNGDPENYFAANNPSQLAAQLGQAFQKAASLSAATSSAVAGNGVRVGGGSFVYQAGYDTIRWGGELSGFTVDVNGNVSNTPTWQATTAQPAPSLRNIVLGGGGTSSKVINTSSFPTLTSTEQGYFKDDNTFKYLLGVRTSEQSWLPSGGTLRNRSSAVGDITNSDPIYINTADFGYTDADYATFKTSAAAAPQLVGFGSNDGFYRLVSATDGVEKLAFIPEGVQSRLSKLANPAYEHEYYVDGPSGFGHVKWGGSWKGVIAGSLGAGGKSVFAMKASVSPSSIDVLWEYSSSLDLGNVLTKPIVGMLENGTTPVVVVGNGLNSTNSRAALLILNAQTGALVRTCKPSDGLGNSAGNGLGSVASVSINGNGKINYVYGSDYKGNIWRFDPNLDGCDSTRVFSAKDASGAAQPVTGEITLVKAPAPKAGYMILFGTGSYITAADPANTQVQSLYGIWDDLGTGTITRASLSAQIITTPSVLSGTRTTSTTAAGSAWFDIASKKGWYLDLNCSDTTICSSGERTIAKPTLLGSGAQQRVFFLSMVPGTDPCQVGGGGWLTSLDPLSGGYVKGFGTITPNSTYIPGVTPRGLFIVQRTATANNPTTDILFVSVTISGGVVPNPRGTVSTGGLRLPGDGSGTAVIGIDVSVCPGCSPAGLGTRRQVWRQIQ